MWLDMVRLKTRPKNSDGSDGPAIHGRHGAYACQRRRAAAFGVRTRRLAAVSNEDGGRWRFSRPGHGPATAHPLSRSRLGRPAAARSGRSRRRQPGVAPAAARPSRAWRHQPGRTTPAAGGRRTVRPTHGGVAARDREGRFPCLSPAATDHTLLTATCSSTRSRRTLWLTSPATLLRHTSVPILRPAGPRPSSLEEDVVAHLTRAPHGNFLKVWPWYGSLRGARLGRAFSFIHNASVGEIDALAKMVHTTYSVFILEALLRPSATFTNNEILNEPRTSR